MTRWSFREDSFGVSVMYDAVLFLVMVSLAGVLLLPALRSPLAVETSVAKHREEVADDALHTFLVSRADVFDYLFCGDLVNGVADSLGINTSSDGLYSVVVHWLLAHEQRHKTYATLLAEDLGCQFRVPLSVLGTNRLNLFTGAFDQQLRNDTERVLSRILGDKYAYNFTAWWHPIRGISFGGEFSVGAPPPLTDTYVSQSILSMPYSPVFRVGNQTFIFTRYAVTHQLFDGDVGVGGSSIPAIANITGILENYTNGRPPYDTRENATRGVHENLSALAYGFLLQGVRNETQVIVFPGIVNMTLSSGFEKIKHLTQQLLETVVNDSFGAVIQSFDRLFSGLNTSVDNPLSSLIFEEFNQTFQRLVNESFGSFDEVFAAGEALISEHVMTLLKNYLDPFLEGFVNTVFDSIDIVREFAEHLVDWLFDCISLATGEVTLTLWVVRE
jgi:hypothetical protein